MADSHFVIIVFLYMMETPSIALEYANKKMSHELLYAWRQSSTFATCWRGGASSF
jgi:hypothetical protein